MKQVIGIIALILIAATATGQTLKCKFQGDGYGPRYSVIKDLGSFTKQVKIESGNSSLSGEHISSLDGNRDIILAVRNYSVKLCQYNFHVAPSAFDACFSAPLVIRPRGYTGNFDYTFNRQQILDGSFGSVNAEDGSQVSISQISLWCAFFEE